MALLGFHIVFSLIAATVFNKFSPQFSLCERLIWKGLQYFWVPEPPEPSDGRRKKNQKHHEPVDFKEKVLCLDMSSEIMKRLTFYTSLVWLIDYGFMSIFVFSASQIWCYLCPYDEATNISILWCLFSITFAVQVLCKILWMKISKAELSSERNLIISFGLVSFLFFMLLNMFGNRILVQDMSKAFDLLLKNSMELAAKQEGFKLEKASPLLLYLSASVVSAFVSCIFLFPVIQYATLYRFSSFEQNNFSSAINGLIFFMPFTILLMYIKPLEELLLKQNENLSPETFAHVRVFFVVGWSVLRLVTLKPLLQAFLQSALEKAMAYSKHVDAFETLRSHLSLLGMTSLQLAVPPFLTLFCALAEIGLGQTLVPQSERSPASMENNVQVILDPRVQQVLWSFSVSVLLIVQTVLSAMGLYFS